MLSGWTVRARLGLGFGVVLLLGVVIALCGALQMARLAGQLDRIANGSLPQVQTFARLKDTHNAIDRHARNVVLDPWPENVAAERRRIAALRDENTRLLQSLADAAAPQTRALLETVREIGPEYERRLDEALTLGEQEHREAATTLLLGEVRKRQDVLFDAIDRASDLQRREAAGAAARAIEVSRRGAWLAGALALAMAVVGFGVVRSLVRGLDRQLGAEPHELGAVAQRVADGDLRGASGAAEAPPGSVLASLTTMQRRLALLVQDVRGVAESIATGSAQVASGAMDLSQRTEAQSSHLQQTAASMHTLNATVEHNRDHAGRASTMAADATRAVAQGSEAVAQVVQTMQGIRGSSLRIADIIGVIDDLAFQTNLLALNAAVEAASAGEQGRGFAVVAVEVRRLAQRSAQAASEIKALIGDSVGHVEAGTRLADAAGTTMTAIVAQVRDVAASVGHISSASIEQAQGIGRLHRAVGELDHATQQNAAFVEESAAAAASLQQQAEELNRLVGRFVLQAPVRPASP